MVKFGGFTAPSLPIPNSGDRQGSLLKHFNFTYVSVYGYVRVWGEPTEATMSFGASITQEYAQTITGAANQTGPL